MIRRRSLGIIVSGLLITLSGAPLAQVGQAPPPELALDRALPIDPAVRSGQLPNGMKYFIRQNGRPAKRVSMRLAVDAGSIQEESDQRGLAHFLEHMAFNGSRNFKPGELVSFLESIGARFGPHVNASTSFDETIYMLDVPSDREGYISRGLLAMSDYASGVSLIAAEVEKERGVVLEEWRGRLGAGMRIMEKQLPVIFQGSRYADRLPIGTPEIIKGAPRERVQAFYEKWYRADRMAIVVVGDIDVKEAENLVRQHFGAMPKPSRPVEDVNRTVPPNKETLYSVATDPEAQGSSVTLAFKHDVEDQKTVADYRRSLARQLVWEMINPRLSEIARRPKAPFLGAQAGADGLGRTLELVELSAAVPEGGLAAGLEALMVEARRVQQFGFGAPELDRARRELLAAYERLYKERGTTESPGYANEYVRHFLEGEPIPGIEFEYKVAATYLPTVTLDEVSALARSLITDDNRIVMAVAPEKKGAPAPTVDDLKSALARAGSAPVERYADATEGRDLVDKPPASGKVVSRRTVEGVGVTVLTLSNGVEVWLKPTDFKNDQILFSSYALGGTSLASESEYKSVSLATGLAAVGGVGGFNPVDLGKMLAGQIAQAQPSIGEYTQGINGSARPGDLETALKLNYLAMTAPNLTPDAFDLLKRRLEGALANRAESPGAVFGERVEQINTSNHYSAQALKVADLPSLNLDAMRRFYQARFANAADFTYFFVGTFSVDELTPLLEKWIGSLPSTGKKSSAPRDMGVRFPTATVREEVKKGKEPRSQTVMAFFADTGLDEFEMHRARAAANVLGIRLREILREELGGTYGVGVSYDNSLPMKGYGAMSIQFGSAPENVDKLVKAVFDEVTRLQKQGPSLDDLNKVKEMERRDLETNARQNSYWVGSLQTVHMLGWDPDGINRRLDRVEKLTPEILHGMFKKYFPMDRYTVVTLKPEV
jgi:zinc protease